MRRFVVSLVLLLLTTFTVSTAVAQEESIVDIASSNSDFSTLVAALQAADPSVLDTLQGDGPFTVLAPTNQAFANLLATTGLTADELFAETDLLTDVLLYHVLPGEFDSEAVASLDGQFADTALEDGVIEVSVNADGTVALNEVVEVIQTDIEASNGIIHVINDVLLPPSALAAFNLNPTVTANNTNVRVLHMASDAPSVDVYLNGEAVITDLPYGESSGYLTVPSGTYQVAVAPTGTSLEDAVLGPAQFDFAGGFLNIAAVGTLANDSLAVTTFTEPFPELDMGEVGVVALHTIEGAPDVDVLLNGAIGIEDLAYPGTQREADGTTNDGAFATVIPAEFESLTINAANTDTVLLDLSGVELTAGNYYLLVAAGTPDAPQALAFETTAAEFQELSMALSAEITGDSMDDMGMSDDDGAMDDESDDMMMEENPTIAEVVTMSATADDPELTILLQAVQNADAAVLETLQDENQSLTVFAPTDEAFSNLLATTSLTADELLASPLLTDILLYHVVPGLVPAEQVVTLDGQSVATLLDGGAIAIGITEDGGVTLNDTVNVTATDVMASNGIVHVIDDVLLPQAALDALGLN